MKNFTEDCLPAPLTQIICLHDFKDNSGLKKGEVVLFLGEIPNMKGHIVIIDNKGHIWWGYAPDSFRYPKYNEV